MDLPVLLRGPAHGSLILHPIVDVQREDSGPADAYLVMTAPGQNVRDPLAKAVVDGGFGLRELRSMDMSLEDVFLQLTNEDSAEA